MVVKSLPNSSLNLVYSLNKPSLEARVLYLLCSLFLLLSSCSTFIIPIKTNKKKNIGEKVGQMQGSDYEDHLASLKKAFLSTKGIKAINLDSSSERYLAKLLNDIILNNEIFFNKVKNASITILDNEAPLHFSLPKGEIFLSKGLISKYVKHESVLAGILSFELIKSEKMLYPIQTAIPLGFFPLERILSINRLNLDEKIEVHKWAHHSTERSGFDGEYYLTWLQTQNRNTADFILLVGDVNQLTREESLFKAFLINETKEDKVITRKNSSKEFYNFINRIRDVL
jgi:hypothetical protein